MSERLPRDLDLEEHGWFETGATSSCPAPELLRPWSAGTLPPSLAARVGSHVPGCATCGALLEALGALEDEEGPNAAEERRIASSIARAKEARKTRRVPTYPWLAAAAAVVAAAGLTLTIGRSGLSHPPVGPPSHDRQLPADAFALPLVRPEIELPPDALVLRGEGPRPYLAALAPALELFKRDRFAEAAAALEDVTALYPDRPYGHFYLGVSLLLSERASDAVAPLQRARRLAGDDPSLGESATWYLAIAFERTGQTSSAVQALADLCAGGRTRRDEACRGLAALRPGLGETGSKPAKPSARGSLIGGRDRPALGATSPSGRLPVS